MDEGYDIQIEEKSRKGIDMNLLLRKGVYPYEYMGSFERFSETTLPAQEKFYNKLNEEALTTEDYNHAKKV